MSCRCLTIVQGKTHTLIGTESEPGITTLAVRDLFRNIQAKYGTECLIRVSYVELYNEELRDLLCPEDEMEKLSIGDHPELGGTDGLLAVAVAVAVAVVAAVTLLVAVVTSAGVVDDDDDDPLTGPYVRGCREHVVMDADSVLRLMNMGEKKRCVHGSTGSSKISAAATFAVTRCACLFVSGTWLAPT